MVKITLKRVTSILTLAIFIFTALAFSPSTETLTKAADSYQLGELIGFEGATANSYEDTTDTQIVKRMCMNGKGRSSKEGDASYYFIFNKNVRNTTSGNLRLSNSNTQNVLFKSKGYLLNVKSTGNDNKSIVGQNFYSTSSDLYARVALVDSQASSSANLNTISQKKESAVMTYEFDLQYKTNFFEILGYVSTHLSGSFSGRNIPAIKVDNKGNLYATTSGFENATSIGSLELGKKHKISVVIKLTPSSQTDKFNYATSVYLDEVEKFTGEGADPVSAKNSAFYGFEFDLRPWTVNTNFSASTAGFTGTADGYYGYGNATSTKLTVANSTLNEYTIIDTDTTISDFSVYAGNMYGDVLRTYSSLDDMEKEINDGTTLTSGQGSAEIKWESSNSALVDVDENAVITIADDEYYGYTIPVSLKATISDGIETTTKTVDVEVRRSTDSWSAQDFVDYDALMPFSYLTNQDQNAVGAPITLPTESESGSTFEWSVSSTEAAGITDNVLSFVPQSKNATNVTLTLTISRNGADSAEVKYPLTVIKAGYSEDEVYKWKHNFETTAEEPAAGIYGDKIDFENWSDIRLGYKWPFQTDASGIVPVNVNVRPVMIVGPFDDAISGFDAQAILQMASSKLATDFEFELSADGDSWDPVTTYYTVGPETKIPDGNAVWTVFEHMYRPTYIDTSKDYRYLKIRFSDASYVSDKYVAASAFDSITVYFDTDVTKAYKDLVFEDMSSEKINAVNNNLYIPSIGTGDTVIEWTSSNPDVITIDAESQTAIVNENAFYGYSIPVTLTAKISKTPESETSGTTREKVFDITIVRNTKGWTNQDYVDYDVLHSASRACLTFGYFTEQPEAMVATNIHLPKKLDGGGNFTWEIEKRDGSSATDVAKIDNYILSFTPQEKAVTPLTLTVTSTKGNAKATRAFDIEVVRGFSDNLILSADVTSSTSGIRKALSRDVVTYWETSQEDSEKTVNIEFSKVTEINSGLVVESGENVSSIKLEVSEDNETWETVYTGESKGDLVREAFAFESVKCKYARFTFESENPIKIATLELYNNIVTNQQAMELSLDALSIPTTTSKNLTLPAKGEFIGDISWTSSDSSVIAVVGTTGKVTRAKNENKTVTLTATLSCDGYESITKTFKVTVAGIVSAGGSGGSSSFGGGASGGSVAAKDYDIPSVENGSVASPSGTFFTDVPNDHWAYEYIDALTKDGVISKADNYRPSDLVTREEFVKLIVAAIGAEADDESDVTFSDSDKNAWYHPFISAAYSKGIVTGNADGSFGIGKSITRQDAAVMLYRAIAKKREIDNMLIFTDSDTVSVYASEAVAYLANERILNGYEDGSFRPFNNLTRAESAKIIYILSTIAKEANNA